MSNDGFSNHKIEVMTGINSRTVQFLKLVKERVTIEIKLTSKWMQEKNYAA